MSDTDSARRTGDVTRTDNSVSVTRHIDASPAEVFAVLSDPSLHPVIDGSGTVRASREASTTRLQMGSRFGMGMRIGLPYVVKNTVVEFDQDRLIAWQHVGGHRWRYELTPDESGTQVTETFDWGGSKARWYILGLKWPQRHIPNMRRTLERLDALLTNRRQPL